MNNREPEESKRYTLEASFKFLKKRQDYYWILVAWAIVLAFAIYQTSVTILIPPLLVTFFMLISDSRGPSIISEIVIQDGVLTIQKSDAVLWSTPQSEIKSIEIEEKGLFQLGARKALVIRTIKNDSYYQSLDGVSAKGYEITEMIDEIFPH
ncbi:MAG: hypothetical protein MI756_20225 [Chromatiales bacterium]|nr:hypothetical protein [Chromatiales bacterium]